MPRNERQTGKELIEPALAAVGWSWHEQLRIGPGRVNITGEAMYDETQSIVADYLLRYKGIPFAVLEAKAEGTSASDGMQQGSRYARRLSLRYSIATNGKEWILTDNETGAFESLAIAPSPEDLIGRMGVSIDWDRWESAFSAPYYMDQVTRKSVRPYQDIAIHKTLWEFAQGGNRALLLMATGTGKTFTVFQLIWKLLNGGALKREHVLFLTDRNSLKDQAYRAFSAYSASERVQIDKDTVAQGQHLVGKIFFANYQNLDEELDGKKVFEHYDPDFFDLVVVDECHRSGFGDWYGVLEHFGGALQLGLTATPRELEEGQNPLSQEEKRRDTQHYFGEPIFTYSLKQAIEDGYLVPYLLEERVTNVDEEGYTHVRPIQFLFHRLLSREGRLRNRRCARPPRSNQGLHVSFCSFLSVSGGSQCLPLSLFRSVRPAHSVADLIGSCECTRQEHAALPVRENTGYRAIRQRTRLVRRRLRHR